MSEFDPVKRVERFRKAWPKRTEEMGECEPPGQYTTEKFPVLTFRSSPGIDLDTWRLRVFGLVEQSVELSWQEFTALPSYHRNRYSLRDSLEQIGDGLGRRGL